MRMSQVAQALDATLHGTDVLMTGVSKDTRDIHSGDLYVALKGERFDGHRFVDDAGQAGAVGVLVSELQANEIAQVQVSDTRVALGQLAAYWCGLWRAKDPQKRLLAITGSNGKTSVKEMCSRILIDFAGAASVHFTRGNLNNDIGLPMTLLELVDDHRYAVIEMGANHVGEIDYLTQIARPDVALVNNVGPAHLQGFGSLQNIARAKAEIFNGLADDGVAVFNQDDVFSPLWQEICADKNTLTFSMSDDSADFYARALGGNRYMFVAAQQQAEVSLKIPGKHNVMNALAAAALCTAVGVPLQQIAVSLSAFENLQGRLTVQQADAGYRVIDDSYNANPLSVSAAIDVLAGYGENTRLVLGDMAELGEDAGHMHEQVGRYAKQAGIKVLYATGELSRSAVAGFGDNGFYFQDKAALIDALEKDLTAADVVLVKGSRSAAMEEVVERILTRKKNNKRVN